MKPILVPYDENMTKEELLKAIADAVGSDVETVKKELCEPKTEPQTDCPQSHICCKPCKECGACEEECGMWEKLKAAMQTERSSE